MNQDSCQWHQAAILIDYWPASSSVDTRVSLWGLQDSSHFRSIVIQFSSPLPAPQEKQQMGNKMGLGKSAETYQQYRKWVCWQHSELMDGHDYTNQFSYTVHLKDSANKHLFCFLSKQFPMRSNLPALSTGSALSFCHSSSQR